MAENSKIEWTHHTFNPWIGCTKIAPPCDNCYAAVLAGRYDWVEWGGPRKRTSEANWRKPIQWNKAAAKADIRYRVFCASLADWLDNQVPQEWRRDLGKLIEATPHLDWLLLTKRIGNYRRLAPWEVAPDNVWLGITCGDQGEYQRDWPKLAEIEAVVRFISYEPALGPLVPEPLNCRYPDWIICGGESGQGARYMEPQWADDMRDYCKRAGINFFMKQMTGKKPIPADLLVRQFPTPLLDN